MIFKVLAVAALYSGLFVALMSAMVWIRSNLPDAEDPVVMPVFIPSVLIFVLLAGFSLSFFVHHVLPQN